MNYLPMIEDLGKEDWFDQYFLPKPEKDFTGYLEREILLGKDLFWPEPERDIFDHIERLILHRVVEKSLGFENLMAMCVLGGLGGVDALLKTKTEEMLWQAIKSQSGVTYQHLLLSSPQHAEVHILLDTISKEAGEKPLPELKRFYRFTKWKLKPVEFIADYFTEEGMYFRDFQEHFKVSHDRFNFLENSLKKFKPFQVYIQEAQNVVCFETPCNWRPSEIPHVRVPDRRENGI